MDTPPYLTWIEGPPPKRNVARSSRAGGAKRNAHFRCRKRKAYGIGAFWGFWPPNFHQSNER